jgi:hypothetical protein
MSLAESPDESFVVSLYGLVAESLSESFADSLDVALLFLLVELSLSHSLIRSFSGSLCFSPRRSPIRLMSRSLTC